ncbi:MAG: hypothetical protein DDT37_01609 [Firmicutes bacterium]|nr:hypothetical protein [candidate division NPL-UPA2 bacterium]
MASGELTYLLHHILHDAGNRQVVLVARFAPLEVDIRVLCGTALPRKLGILCAAAEVTHGPHIYECSHSLKANLTDLLHLMRSPKAIEKV